MDGISEELLKWLLGGMALALVAVSAAFVQVLRLLSKEKDRRLRDMKELLDHVEDE